MNDTEYRRTRLGGSDVAAVLGMSRYNTKLGVFLEKKGLIQPPDLKDIMRVGLLLEPVLDRAYRLQTGNSTYEPKEMRHPSYPFLGGHIDRILTDNTKILEMKTAGMFTVHKWGESGTNDVPIEYIVQCSSYMSVADINTTDLFTAFLGNDERKLLARVDVLDQHRISIMSRGLRTELYKIDRDLQFEKIMLDGVKEFWEEHILANVIPDMDGSVQAKQYLNSKWPTHDNVIINASDAADELFMKFLLAEEGEQEKYKNLLKDAIGNNLGMQFEGAKITWRSDKNGRRNFRINMKGL